MSSSQRMPSVLGWRGGALAFTLSSALAACGGEPEGPHAPLGATTPTGEAAAGDPGATVLAGEIELSGGLAGLAQAAVFVIGFDAASHQLVLVDKLAIADAERLASGERRLPFALGTSHSMTGARIEELELEVRIDLDGLVDGPDDIVGRVRQPVRLGDLGVRVRLGDGERTAVPLGG